MIRVAGTHVTVVLTDLSVSSRMVKCGPPGGASSASASAEQCPVAASPAISAAAPRVRCPCNYLKSAAQSAYRWAVSILLSLKKKM